MRCFDEWAVIDTETTGLRHPIYPVEIACQVMREWQPDGPPFHVLLNFDVPIEPNAEKIHGYSREYLRKNGLQPQAGIDMFLEYADKRPVVAYNLSYDWNRVLAPTFQRMGIPTRLQRGFCALDLTRNLVPSLTNFKLKTVIKTFGVATKQKHHAGDDVALLVQFLSDHVGPHLTQHGVEGFDLVTSCSEGSIGVPPLVPPSAARKNSKASKTRKAIDAETLFAIGELVGICRMIALDRHLSADEFNFLANWLEQCPYAGTPPISTLFDLIRKILEDGHVTTTEQKSLIEAIQSLLAWHPDLSM